MAALDSRPQPGDIVVTTRRVSAFAGSVFDVVLGSQEIKYIVLSGIASGGVVLSTLRQAADLDERITVLADCCAEADEHSVPVPGRRDERPGVGGVTGASLNGTYGGRHRCPPRCPRMTRCPR